MLRTSFLLQKLKKVTNSVNTVDRVMIHALCTSADGLLSMYQVSFNSLLYFQRYAPEKLFIANMKRGSDSVNTIDRAMIHSCIVQVSSWPSISVSSFIKFPLLLEICSR